jgi:hypothetical protein
VCVFLFVKLVCSLQMDHILGIDQSIFNFINAHIVCEIFVAIVLFVVFKFYLMF